MPDTSMGRFKKRIAPSGSNPAFFARATPNPSASNSRFLEYASTTNFSTKPRTATSITPRAGELIETATPFFEWTSVPEADRYELSFTQGHVFTNLPVVVDDPSWAWPAGEFQIPPGTAGGLRWMVRAFDDQGALVGETEFIHGAELAIPE